MRKLRVVFIGCVDLSHRLLTQLLEVPTATVVGVVSRERSSLNSDFRPLAPLANEHGIPLYLSDVSGRDGMSSWIAGHRPDVCYCFGWSQLLGADVLDAAPFGVVGYHPTELPRNRGRHPIIWTLVLGLDRTASTFFFMDQGADSGDILDQVPVEVHDEDDAAQLYERLAAVATQQLVRFSDLEYLTHFERRPQDHSLANTWRKRTKDDGRIDWRMASRSIYNLVRALAPPYPGAHAVVGGQDVRILRARVESDGGPLNLEPGRVVAVAGREVIVQCGVGRIRLIDHELEPVPEPGSYL